jgi:hypothetical protein
MSASVKTQASPFSWGRQAYNFDGDLLELGLLAQACRLEPVAHVLQTQSARRGTFIGSSGQRPMKSRCWHLTQVPPEKSFRSVLSPAQQRRSGRHLRCRSMIEPSSIRFCTTRSQP